MGYFPTKFQYLSSLKNSVRRLVAENGWLREELANTQSKLCDAEQRATKAEEERAHYKEGFILISQFNSHSNREMINLTLK